MICPKSRPDATKVFLCILSAVLLSLSLSFSWAWMLAWIGFLPFLLSIKGSSIKKVFKRSYLTGLFFYLVLLWWLKYVSLLGLVVLSVYLATYFGIFGLFFSLFYARTRRNQITLLVALPCVWVVLEFIRAFLFTGFPWALIGHSQGPAISIIQIADITGAYGVSFLVIMTNLLLFLIIDTKSLRKALIPFLIFIVFLGFSLIYGQIRIKGLVEKGLPVRISVIQGNISQEDKWNPRLKGLIIKKYALLTRIAALEKPDIIIWPETALPGDIELDKEIFKEVTSLAQEINISILAGTVKYIGEGRNDVFNRAVLVSKEGRIISSYDKLHLVPFGEYLPLRRVFSPRLFKPIAELIGDFKPGDERTVFNLPELPAVKFGVLVCFEDIFPHLVRGFVNRGADFMVNITNDGWLKDSSGPFQHAQGSIFRAVENRMNVVRAANTGLSSFIDPCGRVVSNVADDKGKSICVDGFKTETIWVYNRASFYTRFGDVFVWGCLVMAVFCGLLLSRKDGR